MRDKILTEAVVITYNSADFIEACLHSIMQSGAPAVVVDNGSSDETVEIVSRGYPEVVLIANRENLGYSGAVNLGVSHTSSDVFLISNADVVFPEKSINTLASFVREHADVGAVGPQQVFPDGSWQKSYDDIPGVWEGIKKVVGMTSFQNWSRRLLWPKKLDRFPKEVGFIPGAVMAVRRHAFDTVGGFDETFHFYVEDVDFCSRLRKAGWRVMVVPSAQVMHVGGASSTRFDASDKYLRQWVNSKLLLLQKNVPEWQVALYTRLERLHAREMLLACRIMRRLAPREAKAYLSAKTSTFEHLLRIWSEQCR